MKVNIFIIITYSVFNIEYVQNRRLLLKTNLNNSSLQEKVKINVYLEHPNDFQSMMKKIQQNLKLPKTNQTEEAQSFRNALEKKIQKKKNWHRFECLNNGKFNRVTQTCKCRKNFKGKWCEEKIEIKTLTTYKILNCDQEPCLNDGECIESDDQNSKCECPLGFQGERCEKKIKECEDYETSPCFDPNDICITTSIGYKCFSYKHLFAH